MEDRAMDRLVQRLEIALMQVALNDPDIEWRSKHG